jgi:hypothetical protein
MARAMPRVCRVPEGKTAREGIRGLTISADKSKRGKRKQ